MSDDVSNHYRGGGALIRKITDKLQSSGIDILVLSAADLEPIDEFHFRGRQATLELAEKMKLSPSAHVLDLGSGLGGAARTLADQYGCTVTGIDLTPDFCDAATEMSRWVNLSDKTEFVVGDATELPFEDNQFNGAITVHAAMNIPAKNQLYAEAKRVLKLGSRFAIYDILQGEGGPPLYPAPWAMDPDISHLATSEEMQALLTGAGFRILDVTDSTKESLDWIESRPAKPDRTGLPAITTAILFGDVFRTMVANQIIGLKERRIRTVGIVCEA
jgi:ubiquinone/menaquinone biosynthesis C-methylase UbiE